MNPDEEKREQARLRMQAHRAKTARPIREKPSKETVREQTRKRVAAHRQRKQADRRTDTAVEKAVEFIGIDGEGVNDPSKTFIWTDDEGVERHTIYQKYVLLCASTGESLYNPDGIGTGEALSWLCNLGVAHPHATFIIFGGGYDVNMWLRDLSFEAQKYLRVYMETDEKTRRDKKMSRPCTPCYKVTDVPHQTHVVFGIEYLPRKEFNCTRYAVEMLENVSNTYQFKRDSSGKKHRYGGITVYDVFGFFQRPFLKACEEYGLFKTIDDRNFIANMKNSRSQFDRLDIDTITKYCIKECELLVELMKLVNSYLRHPEIDLKLQRWDGAGAIAAALMKKYGVKDHIEELPEAVLLAATHAYSGGRIELVQYGHTEGECCVYDYDLNSAYPTTMVNLPSLVGGYWSRDPAPTTKFCLCHVKWDLGGQRIYPFFYRCQNGTILYPEKGENWVWLPEYEAYLEHQGEYSGSVTLVECWNFHEKDETVRPFDFIPRLAAQRLKWKADFKESKGEHGGQHVVIKLGLNSIYGKLAQQIGGSYNETTNKMELPPYHNIAWAGFVTADTRAKLYRAAMRRPDSVVMFATDGLFTTASQPELTLSPGLGDWEVSTVRSFTACQSGVYWYHNGGKVDQKTRGFEKGSITEDMVKAGWEAGPPKSVLVDGKRQPAAPWQVTGSSQLFITFGMIAVCQSDETIIRNMRRLCGWEQKPRILSLTPYGTKRADDPKISPRANLKKYNPAKQLIPTVPTTNFDYEVDGLVSKPYKYQWLTHFRDLSPDEIAYMVGLEEAQEWETQQ